MPRSARAFKCKLTNKVCPVGPFIDDDDWSFFARWFWDNGLCPIDRYQDLTRDIFENGKSIRIYDEECVYAKFRNELVDAD